MMILGYENSSKEEKCFNNEAFGSFRWFAV